MGIIHRAIYRRDSAGKLRQWYVIEDGPGYVVAEGLVDGKLRFSTPTICKGKNIGKANETTPEAQCSKQVAALYTKQLARKWHSTPECTDWKPPFPMLANTFEGPVKDGSQLFSQPKLDGVRCLSFLHDGEVTFWSREGQRFPDFPHIRRGIEPLLHAFPSLILDGELYNHELNEDFGAIVSAVKGGDEDQMELLQYHVYDCANGIDRFGWRNSWLKGVMQRLCPSLPIVSVQTHLVTSEFTRNSLMEHYLAQGYEGQMIRLDRPYEQGKRSASLLKCKEFQDAEFPVVSLNEGVGNYTGCIKSITARLPDGREFNAQVKGPRSYLRSLMDTHVDTIGQATIKFFKYTPDGIPRFPVVKAFWEGERDV